MTTQGIPCFSLLPENLGLVRLVAPDFGVTGLDVGRAGTGGGASPERPVLSVEEGPLGDRVGPSAFLGVSEVALLFERTDTTLAGRFAGAAGLAAGWNGVRLVLRTVLAVERALLLDAVLVRDALAAASVRLKTPCPTPAASAEVVDPGVEATRCRGDVSEVVPFAFPLGFSTGLSTLVCWSPCLRDIELGRGADDAMLLIDDADFGLSEDLPSFALSEGAWGARTCEALAADRLDALDPVARVLRAFKAIAPALDILGRLVATANEAEDEPAEELLATDLRAALRFSIEARKLLGPEMGVLAMSSASTLSTRVCVRRNPVLVSGLRFGTALDCARSSTGMPSSVIRVQSV